MCSPPLARGEPCSGVLSRDWTDAVERATASSVQSRVRPRNTVVWLSCGFDRPPSRDAVDRFLTDLEHVVDEVFDRLSSMPPPRPARLDLPIDSTDVRTMPADQDASKGYDPTAEERYYHGYGCRIVSTGQKIPIAAEFTESKPGSPDRRRHRHV